MHTAELDLTKKIAAQRAADRQHNEDRAALDATKAQLAAFQSAVDKFAVSTYMGGRTDGMYAILTAASPQQLISKLAVQRVVAVEMADLMTRYRAAADRAVRAEQQSAKSAAEAKTAAEQAAAVRATLQSKQSQLQLQIAVVKSQYQELTPEQRTALADPGPAPPQATLTAAVHGPEALAPGGGAPGDPGPEVSPAEPGDGQGSVAVQAALTQVGSPYAWGGAGPGGFDCSGLVMWAFQQAGIALPHSSQALAHGGQPVALSDLQPGDVLTFYSDASHAGIYIGDGLMVHSSTYGQPVRVVPMTASGPIYNARRY
ncbi:MAG: NlpC/P60 family protein [Mycobacterium sp.]|nr:MAG: NlpC/P60 family protein [Mycobacterium sp.]